MKNKVLFMAIAVLATSSLKAQLNVGSTSAADPSAILQATSTTKGFLPPVMTTTQRNAIVTPAPGLLIFNSTTNQQEVNSGTTDTPIWGANTAATFYNADGTLATNRIVTQGANTLTFTGAGNFTKLSGNNGAYPWVQIGRAAAEVNLTVAVASNQYMLGSVAGDMMMFTNGGAFLSGSSVNLSIGATQKLTVAGSGNVGINTTTPAATLDVAGNMRLATTASGASTDSILTINNSTGIINKRALPSIVLPTIFGAGGQNGATNGTYVTSATGPYYTGWYITIPANSKYIVNSQVFMTPNTSYTANSSLLLNLNLSTSASSIVTFNSAGYNFGGKGINMYVLANANNQYVTQAGNFWVQNTTAVPLTLYLWLSVNNTVGSYTGSFIILNPGADVNQLYGVPVN